MQETRVSWYKFTGQAGTKLPTCDEVDGYKTSDWRYQNTLVFCIKGQHPRHSSSLMILLQTKGIHIENSTMNHRIAPWT